jgi:hypothetical protein
MTRVVLLIFIAFVQVFAGILPTIQGYDNRIGKPIWGVTDSEAYNGKSDAIRKNEGQLLPPQTNSNSNEYMPYKGTGLETLAFTIINATGRLSYGSDSSPKPLLNQTVTIRLGEIKTINLNFADPKDSQENYNMAVQVEIAYTTEGGKTTPTLILDTNANTPVFIPVTVDNIANGSMATIESNSKNSKHINGRLIFRGGE